MQMSEPDKVQRTDNGKEEKPAGEFVRSFYIRRILLTYRLSTTEGARRLSMSVRAR